MNKKKFKYCYLNCNLMQKNILLEDNADYVYHAQKWHIHQKKCTFWHENDEMTITMNHKKI